MPPLTYIHASEAARTTAGGGGVAAAELPPPKIGYGRGKGRRGEMCVHRARRSPTAGLLRALSRICIRFVFTSRKHIYNSPN